MDLIIVSIMLGILYYIYLVAFYMSFIGDKINKIYLKYAYGTLH